MSVSAKARRVRSASTFLLRISLGACKNVNLTKDVKKAYRMVSIPRTRVRWIPALNPSMHDTTLGLLSPSSMVTENVASKGHPTASSIGLTRSTCCAT
uniref:Guanine nucleotide-exchange, putative n=1 Tax=Arundo donax TaxID=35708 RepID=A0A0A9CG86_ARUDO